MAAGGVATYGVPIIAFEDPSLKEHLFNKFYPREVIERQGEQAGRESFEDLLRHMSHPPVYSTLRVNTNQYDVENVRRDVEDTLQETEPNHRFSVSVHPTLQEVFVIESMTAAVGALQPRSNKEVIIDSYCGAAVLRGANIFGIGVMGLSKGSGLTDSVSVFVDLDGKCRRGLKEPYLGRKTLVANGTLKISRQDLFEGRQNARGVAVEIDESFVANPSLNDMLPEKVFAQNIPSIVCSLVLDPQPGESVLDMCAAPGGKTTHIATLMRDEGIVIALEKAKGKVRTIRQNARKFGLTSIQAFHKQAENAVTPGSQVPSERRWPPYKSGSFDRVLLDAPCSGTGQRAQIKCAHAVQFVKSFPHYQRKLFHAAVEAVKEEGTIVYSTCSLTTSENEALVAWALGTFPKLELSPQTPYLGSPGVVCHGLTEAQAGLLQRFWPSSKLAGNPEADCNKDTIGFFIAKFIKKR